MSIWEKIESLEKTHSMVHNELLLTIDLLYLQKKAGYQLSFSPDLMQKLEIRRNIQMSLEKTGAILKSVVKSGSMAKQPGSAPALTTEELLAQRLQDLERQNHDLALSIYELDDQNTFLRSILDKERDKYSQLLQKFQNECQILTDKVTHQKSSTSSNGDISSVDIDPTLQAKVHALQEILNVLRLDAGCSIDELR
ncbi:hypothetical protein TBLA_0F02640 [Henningerozyma blattae CBS 6284]|uniref:Uncharacterized protein n=1 Tax=Henningerozyma blattae (strain ATCC 34711 / CBS 6284 / DSM 70876 / NBRC 10599 / NRRL Y-10934 / UCD 77-7) TaxID=1071380 RepID=I2H601_HENB6|nr:hypothetical protein TBLA_0F02640 [Tetrapisispora blattae CBS 6284]CCH61803.1 hypothetical protein TBLA_0F02640 [Tetrapisispora blattae CBS 6284]